jgi:rubrerythrin
MDLDFSKLSVQDALDLAILVEEEAQERYEEFAKILAAHHSPEVATFFTFMAGNEAKHGADLRARRTTEFGAAPVRVDRTMLWDAEAPEVSEVRAFMSVRQGLEIALAAEVKAYDFFRSALAEIDHPDVRALFTELRDEEVEHQEMVKRELAKLGPEPDLNPDDFVDPPAAQ